MTRTVRPGPIRPKWATTHEAVTRHWVEACRRGRHAAGLKLGKRLDRLLAAEFARRVAHHSPDTRVSRAIDVAERVADGRAGDRERRQAWAGALGAWSAARTLDLPVAVALAAAAAMAAASGGLSTAARTAAAASGDREREWAAQGELVACVAGPWEFDPAWRTSTAVALAERIYRGRDWGMMPILADALEDADCDADELLARMRDRSAQWCLGARILDDLQRLRGE